MPTDISPLELHSALRGIDYPAARNRLIKFARDHDAPAEVITVLSSLADASSYDSPRAVARAACG